MRVGEGLLDEDLYVVGNNALGWGEREKFGSALHRGRHVPRGEESATVEFPSATKLRELPRIFLTGAYISDRICHRYRI